jgi:tetratricopeptide (TPR) repeat protein
VKRPARLAAVAALLAAAAAADQRAPELDTLFAALHDADSVAEAVVVERRIWRLWIQSGDAGVDARLARGITAMNHGHLEAAIDHFSHVVERAPQFAEGWNKRATAFYLRDQLTASMADIERTLALEPRHFGAISGLGLIFLERGDLVAALEAFERVLQIHPRSRSARVQVRRIRERLRGRVA